MNPKALSGADLARCFGVDRAMVTRWKKAGMPENKGLFSLPECIRWRLDREAEAVAPKSTTPEGEKWLTRFRRERARSARLERLAKQGKLLPREDLLPEWVQVYGEFRQACLSLENKLPPLVEGKGQEDIRQVIRSHTRAMLTALSRPGTNRPDPTKACEAEPITPKAKRGRPRKS
jgi:phage terminase Nu1 subunit (DNA packaging protein)